MSGDEPTERDVEALAERLRRAFWDPDNGGQWGRIAAAVLTADWYAERILAERIAQARREGAADALDEACDGLRGKDGITVQWLRDRAEDLRGDA